MLDLYMDHYITIPAVQKAKLQFHLYLRINAQYLQLFTVLFSVMFCLVQLSNY